MMKKMSVYELIIKLGRNDITSEEVVELVGTYPVLSHMILTGTKNSGSLNMILEITRVVPEVTCETVEKRLRKYPTGTEVKVKGIPSGVEGREKEKVQVKKEGEGQKPVTISKPEEKGKEGVKKVTKPVKKVDKGQEHTTKRRVEVEDHGSNTDYEKLSVVKCYELCLKRGIQCKTKQKKEFYVDLLENYDTNQEMNEWDQLESEWEGVE